MTRFMDGQYCINRFRGARADPSLVVLEGLHPLKHALRFGAEIVEAVSVDRERLLELAGRLAPDIIDRLRQCIVPVDLEVFEELAPVPPATGVIALAKRPAIVVGDVLGGASLAPVVLLERPRNPFNIGASVRVAAAAGAAGFLTTGIQDPWHPSAVLSGVGLHFALPVARIDTIEAVAGTHYDRDPAGNGHWWLSTRSAILWRRGSSRTARCWPSATSGTESARNWPVWLTAASRSE